jgi:hypothetical protein
MDIFFYKRVQLSGPFENQTGNRMVKDHWKTGHKLCPENGHAITNNPFFRCLL